MKPFQSPPHPPATSSWNAWATRALIHLLTAVGIFPCITYYLLFRREDFLSILRKARQETIKNKEFYQDDKLINKVVQSPVAQAYIQGGLEYQLREGFCSSATIRCILKSIPNMSYENIPPVKGGASIPTIVKNNIDNATNGLTKTTIVYGSDGYDAFRQVLKKANDPRFRVGANFLRSPLFGYISPWFVPFHFILGLFGGHFSPIIGYLEDEDLVAIFDVNHTYGGIYLVESQRLFGAIDTIDLSVKNKITRALLVTEIIEPHSQTGDDKLVN